MPYDFYTDIKNLTGLNPSDSIMDWAVLQAKTFYIADDPANYDEDISEVDNRLVAMLAAGFVTLQTFGISVAATFQLDEFSVKESSDNKPELKFFDMFYRWLARYLGLGILLQWADTDTIMLVSDYDPTLYEITRATPTGLE